MIDDGSTDAHRRRRPRAPAPGWSREADVLPEAGPGSGKGNALWKSLHACAGDLICWLDADLRNFRADTVARLVEPLVADSDTVLVKASYTRSFEGAPDRRRARDRARRPAAALTAVPQARRHRATARRRVRGAARRARRCCPFVEGWGVELGLLVDVVERFGRDAVAQVDLGTREHRNRPVEELAAQSLAIIATALRRAGLMQFDGPTLELAARRPRRQRRRRAGRDPRTPPDRDDPRVPRAALLIRTGVSCGRVVTPSHAGSVSRAARPASTAASSTRSAAR